MRTWLILCLFTMAFILAACQTNESIDFTAAPWLKNLAVEKTSGGDLAIQPINRSSVRFEFRGQQYYVDPSGDADWDRMPKADVIFVSHEHGDHLDLAAIAKITQKHTVVYTSAATIEKVKSEKDKPENLPTFYLIVHGKPKKLRNIDVTYWNLAMLDASGPHISELQDGDDKPFDITVEAVPAYNMSEGKLNFHPKDRKDNGYVLTFGNKRVYIACDTEATPEMKALKNIDIALLPCDPRYTMSVEEAVEAAKIIKPKIFYPYHQGPSDPNEAAKLLAGEKEIEVRVLSLP